MPRRIAGDATDRDYVGDRCYTVVLDGQFFTLGPIITADEIAGTIEYFPVDKAGNFRFDQAVGCWVRASVTGQVRIYSEMGQC